MKNIKFVTLLMAIMSLSACAGVLPVPGGGETINKDFYETDEQMKQLISEVKKGDSREAVFKNLGRNDEDFILLTRDELMSTLYGGQRLEFVQNLSNPLKERSFLQDLKGYRMVFKKVKRKHGIHTPISIRTNEIGYSYTATFIFKEGVLYEEPVLAGGSVKISSTKTIFDNLSPSTVMGRFGL